MTTFNQRDLHGDLVKYAAGLSFITNAIPSASDLVVRGHAAEASGRHHPRTAGINVQAEAAGTRQQGAGREGDVAGGFQIAHYLHVLDHYCCDLSECKRLGIGKKPRALYRRMRLNGTIRQLSLAHVEGVKVH